ncbi:MAG: hypothetical protein IKL85_07465 [Lentisphaeria bacterium]|nr:hypothetical protein [Lentisphaeria bacterium]
MVAYSEIICDYFMVQQDDIRLREELDENPARFFRKMALYLKNGIPLFNRPPEAKAWLKHEDPEWDDFEIETETVTEPGDTIDTGITGYELCSVGTLEEDDLGDPVYRKVDADYDSDTGIITVNEALGVGAKVQADFYTDGQFEYDLTEDMKNILGLCVQYVWERRFNNDFLSRTQKVKDDSFEVGNESNWIAKGTERLKVIYGQLNSAMVGFEQGLAAMETLPSSRKFKGPVG